MIVTIQINEPELEMNLKVHHKSAIVPAGTYNLAVELVGSSYCW